MIGNGMLKLAKPSFDICLFTNDAAGITGFWRDEIGLTPEDPINIREGLVQHRFVCGTAVIKINEQAAPLRASGPSGYRTLVIARDGCAVPIKLADPQGNRVLIVPPGPIAAGAIGMHYAVRDVAQARSFFAETLRLPVDEANMVAIGDSRLLLLEHPAAVIDPPVEAPGWRYMTLQIFDAYGLYGEIVANGGREGRPPRTLGTIARYALVRDPEGNWVELSQRASLTGPFEADEPEMTAHAQGVA